MTNTGIRTHRRTPARDADSPVASTQRRLALREVLRFASPWTRSLTGAGSPEPARPRPARSTAKPWSSRPPTLACAAQGRPRPALPAGVALRDRPATASNRADPPLSWGNAERHRRTDTDARVCRRGRIVLGRSSLHHILRFFLHHGRQQRPTANSSVPRANPPPTRPRHTPPGMMRGAGRPSTCLLCQPYMAQGNPKRALCPSHPSPAPDER